ncbi:MAG: sulfite exporter TauE/SafE family protein [Bacteroidales bacterium]|nr:sulfite exporter TauE/SafE family protein [Bacteroidales bacterium]
MSGGILILLLALCASFVQRTIGFGFGILIMTMLPLLMPSYGEATTLSGLLAMFTSMVVTVQMHRFITWKRLLPVLGVFMIVSSVAIFLLPGINDKAIMLVLGVVLILTSLYFILLSGRIHIRPTLPSQIGTGILSGLMGGFFAMQGPPAVLYFLSSEKDKEHYLAMISAYLLIGNFATTLVRSANGFMTREVGVGFLWGIAGVAAGAFLGAKAFKRIPHKVFDYIVYAYIAFSGVVILLNALHR